MIADVESCLARIEGLVATRRRRVHCRAAEALAATTGPDPDAVADHFRRAGDPRAAMWLVRAGDRAERTYAWPTAVARFEAALVASHGALSTDEHCWTLVRLAALRRIDDRPRALAYLDEAGEAIAASADPLLGPYALLVAGLPAWRVNPRAARHFAEAIGRRARASLSQRAERESRSNSTAEAVETAGTGASMTGSGSAVIASRRVGSTVSQR